MASLRRIWRPCVVLWVLLTASAAAAAPRRPLVEGLDHTPVAVTDLDQAAADFSKLGFIIKPGRPHDDGIRNRHVKFPNGGEIELITASKPTDALARDYVDWLKGGEGPAFWSLYSPDLVALTAFLTRRGLDPDNQGDLVTFSRTAMPHRLFFADRLRSPTDGVAYWAHPNTAYKLAGVWLAGTAPEQTLLPELGAKRSHRVRCSPFDRHAVAFDLPEAGDQVMVSRSVRPPPERSIIGLTVLVKSLATARGLLDANHVAYASPERCRPHSLWVPPAAAHQTWLEFYERGAGSRG